MSESNTLLSKVWKRKISAFAILLLILLAGAAIAEWLGAINIIQSSETPPYQIDTASQLIGAIGSILLTIGLVVLYDKQASVAKQQASIQENQEELMQADYEPKLKASLGFKEVQTLQFEIHNSGKAAAHDVQLRWEYGEQQFSWGKSVMPSGDMTGFPLKNKNDDWLFGPDETREFFDKLDGSNIIYKIKCNDILDNTHEFEGMIDAIDIIDSQTNPPAFTNRDDMVDELSDIDSTLQKIHKEIRPSPLDRLKSRGKLTTEESDVEEPTEDEENN